MFKGPLNMEVDFWVHQMLTLWDCRLGWSPSKTQKDSRINFLTNFSLKELAKDFWFHTPHEHQFPGYKSCACLSRPPSLASSLCRLCHSLHDVTWFNPFLRSLEVVNRRHTELLAKDNPHSHFLCFGLCRNEIAFDFYISKCYLKPMSENYADTKVNISELMLMDDASCFSCLIHYQRGFNTDYTDDTSAGLNEESNAF